MAKRSGRKTKRRGKRKKKEKRRFAYERDAIVAIRVTSALRERSPPLRAPRRPKAF